MSCAKFHFDICLKMDIIYLHLEGKVSNHNKVIPSEFLIFYVQKIYAIFHVTSSLGELDAKPNLYNSYSKYITVHIKKIKLVSGNLEQSSNPDLEIKFLFEICLTWLHI
ncbi:hypothetical protein Avbf_08179 [Armadillidium vulgare]|nr:hypothetical protein Avbf_08179 [Armadillidium vulgare]